MKVQTVSAVLATDAVVDVEADVVTAAAADAVIAVGADVDIAVAIVAAVDVRDSKIVFDEQPEI